MSGSYGLGSPRGGAVIVMKNYHQHLPSRTTNKMAAPNIRDGILMNQDLFDHTQNKKLTKTLAKPQMSKRNKTATKLPSQIGTPNSAEGGCGVSTQMDDLASR